MEYDFNDNTVNKIRKSDPELTSRLEAQVEAVDELRCTNPAVGKWIDAYDVQYLFAAFALDDEDFAENFPKMAELTQHDRKRILKTFETHLDNCSHCHLKRGFDLEIDSRIERVFRENKDNLTHELNPEASETESEADHLKLEELLTAAK